MIELPRDDNFIEQTLPIDQVICGDSLEVLKTFPTNSVDAIVCDPPAGINFMGKDFDKDRGGRNQWVAWLAEIMREAMRCLRPGGYGLIWALPRTSHWTATALEDAGWEIRDCCYHIAGSGFPKSLDISKAIDKHLGKKREIVGMANGTGMSSLGVMHDDEWKPQGANLPITAPATPEAAQWQGWGSALKPAVECWWLCRKPISEKTIAANVLKWHTGALNIDATRVGTDNTIRSAKGGGYDGGWKPLDVSGSTQGRWPSHLLLSHSIFCVPTGVKRVHDSLVPVSRSNSRSVYGDYTGATMPLPHTDEDGMEEVEAYQCHESCPIAELDRQSGVRKSHPSGYNWEPSSMNGQNATPILGNHYIKSGASRYFQNFPVDEPDFIPFTYTPKASRSERNAGYEGLPEGTKPSTVYLNNRRCRNCGKQQVSGSPCHCDTPDWEIIERGKKGNNGMSATNTHPT